MKLTNLFCLVSVAVPLFLLLEHFTIADSWIERDATFTWEIVPSAFTNPDLGNADVNPGPWHINTNSLIRRGSLVSFETVSPEGQYFEFLGNCETTHITSRFVGEFLSATRIRYRQAELDWQLAEDWRSHLLMFACDPTSLDEGG